MSEEGEIGSLEGSGLSCDRPLCNHNGRAGRLAKLRHQETERAVRTGAAAAQKMANIR